MHWGKGCSPLQPSLEGDGWLELVLTGSNFVNLIFTLTG